MGTIIHKGQVNELKKHQIIKQIKDHGVVAVLRGESPEEVVEMARQCIAGGIKIIEVTMTVPGALRAISTLAEEYSCNVSPEDSRFAVIGSGTVLDPETARATLLAGAEFVVSPSLNKETIVLCNRYCVPVLPGTMTVQDIVTALELGVDVVKLFPGNLYSPSVIPSIKGPLPQANIMPTGGVSLDNLAEWIKAGAFAVGIGSDLTKEALKQKDYTLVKEKARAYVEVFKAASK